MNYPWLCGLPFKNFIMNSCDNILTEKNALTTEWICNLICFFNISLRLVCVLKKSNEVPLGENIGTQIQDV